MSLPECFRSCVQHLRARVHAPMLLSIGLLVGLEVLVARHDWVWDYVPRARGAMVTVTEEVLLGPVQSPELVILGSSRARDAVSPRALERYAGIPRGRAVNLGVTGGTPFDALLVYRRNRAKLSHSRLLVLALDPWGFEATKPNEIDRRYATLRDRLLLYDRQYVASLLVGWLWRTWDAKEAMWRVVKTEGRRRLRGELSVRKAFETPPMGPDGRLAYRKPHDVDKTDKAINRVVEAVCSRYVPGEGRLRQAQELIDMATSDGVPVLVVLFPTRAKFRDAVRSRYPIVYADFHRQVPLLKGARLKLWETPREAGLDEEDFDDYGHISAHGAVLMAEELARVIRQWYPDAVAQGGPSDRQGG